MWRFCPAFECHLRDHSTRLDRQQQMHIFRVGSRVHRQNCTEFERHICILVLCVDDTVTKNMLIERLFLTESKDVWSKCSLTFY